jgi:hypothetical protein
LEPFDLDVGDLLEPAPALVVEDGVAFGMRAAAGERARRLPPLLTVAWTEEPPGAALDDVVAEELARTLIGPEAVLVDHEATTLGGVAAQRTLLVHRGPDGLPTAAEQWRLPAAGRRWTITAMTALEDQPELGPALAAIVASFRIAAAA